MKFLKMYYRMNCKINPRIFIRRSMCSQRVNLGLSQNGLTKTLGQPSFETHSYLLKENEIVPGFTVQDFIKRREQLIRNILKTKSNTSHLVIVPSALTQYMTGKIPYVFRQNTDFRYLTGCLEPDCALLIIIESETKYNTTLFLRDKSSHSELWEGPRTGIDIAPDIFGVDCAKPIHNLANFLRELKINNFTLWYDSATPVNAFVHNTIASYLGDCGSKELMQLHRQIHELRLIKSESEQDLMIKSAEIASNAIELTIKSTKSGVTEHQLFATVDYYCRMHGAEYLAYPPVVAAGNNATIIHYINNNQEVKENDLILMDAGCEYHGYCSDITRTWPASGTFTPIQKTLYDIVLSVQLELLSACNEVQSLDDLFNIMCKLLGRRLKEAHVLSKAANNLTLDEVAFKLCPHHVGHFLGMDIHDTGTISRKSQLKEGMVITVEPGIYINSTNYLTKPEFRGNGIRIEDDVLFTNNGPKVISTCPKTIEDMESFCKR